METTYILQKGKIVEVTTTEVEHDPIGIIDLLQAQIVEKEKGRDDYIAQVNADIDLLKDKIDAIQKVLGK